MCHLHFGSFDRAVALTVVGLVLIIALVIWQGDRLGVQVMALTPATGARTVSTRTRLQIRFDQPMVAPNNDVTLLLTPPTPGDLQIVGDRLLFVPATPLLPNTDYTATLTGDLRSAQGRRLYTPFTWQFRTTQPQVLYSNLDAEGHEQLYTVTVDLNKPGQAVGVPTQLTHLVGSVWDFTVSPTDSRVLYSTLKEDSTSDLWSVGVGEQKALLLIPCPNAVCSSAVWSPDGQTLAYSRRNATDFGSPALSPPRLWLFDANANETAPLFVDDQKLAFEPRWSGDGRWLSYVSPDLGGVGAVQADGNDEHIYPSTSGEAAVWHPQNNQFVFSIMQQVGEQFVSHLLLTDPATNAQQNLSGAENLVEDGSSAWSPDGAWLAFRRKELQGPRATLGKQLWRMRPDGTDAQPLTSDPAFDHGQPAWSPDGRYLLFHKLPLKGPDITLSVWLLNVETGEAWEVARPGQRPIWVP